VTSTALSPVIYAGILLAFLLPFATVSCDDEAVTFTGVELAFGQVEEPAPGSTLDDEIEDDAGVFAFAAVAAAVVGLALGVARRRGAGVAAGLGTAATLLLGSRASQLLGPTVDVHVGYLLALVGYFCLSLGHFVAWIRRWRAGRRTRPDAPSAVR
jgi:hypothetical protein